MFARREPSRGHRQSVQDVAQGVLGDTLSDLTDSVSPNASKMKYGGLE
jgi:hypothetical protein